MQPISRIFSRTVLAIIAVELFAMASFFVPSARSAAFAVVVFGMVVLTIRRFDIAFLVLIAELVVGAQGHLFEYTVGGFTTPLRLAFFCILFFVWLFRTLRSRSFPFRHARIFWWVGALLVTVAAGVVMGLARGNGLKAVFYDANAFLYLALAPVFYEQIRSRVQVERLIGVVMAGVVFLAVQSLLLLAAFSHDNTFVVEIYRWVRDSRLYEINRMAKNFFRVFSQAQFFSVVGFFLLLALKRRMKDFRFRAWWWLMLAALIGICISFSRSFWIAILVVAAFPLPMLFRKLGWSWRKLLLLIPSVGALCIIALLILSFAANYPYLWNRPGGERTLALFETRTTDMQEAAAGSRYALLGPLMRTAIKHPVIGSGFGTTVTYQTKDPHFVAQAGGVRTTYAFEWGYLDQWLKVGAVGVFVLLGFLVAILQTLRRAWRASPDERDVTAGFLLVVFALCCTHVITPYLNHPIGVGLLLCAGAAGESIIRRPERSFHDVV